MSGVNKGLQPRFRHVVPFQLYINCRNHRLALCVSHLVKQYPVLLDLDAVMFTIWKLKFSAQRFANLIDELEHLSNRFTQVGVCVHDELYFSKLPMIWDLIDERRELARRLRDEGPIQQLAEEVARPMVYSLIQELEDAFHCSLALGPFSVFDMRHVPSNPLELGDYGQTSISHIADHYGEAKQDTFMGHHVVAQPEFPVEIIRREFSAFKHQMFIMKMLK
ncbi:uncharacterized protein LOC132733267 isoform X6 [Ruditapes philippinarum]|uniref:uncharacterized protein LOC132733267 isoform X6 n=1 Tax=Ruditapes philippinarum TaxID=129788 RepID=UPI00295C190A|nr:uncharacterized protein LOC132733267 isoform X6 [Ruditapes philippinarum]